MWQNVVHQHEVLVCISKRCGPMCGRLRCDMMIISSVTRLGNFWKFLATNKITKVAQIFGYFWGCVKNIILSKNCRENVMGHFCIIWATFYSKVWSHWSSVVAAWSPVIREKRNVYLTTTWCTGELRVLV